MNNNIMQNATPLKPHNFHRIPYELRQYRQWISWRYEDHGGPKPTKVPYCPRTGQFASVIDPSSWVTFDEAVAAFEFYDGIGFVLTPQDPYAVVDLDHTLDPHLAAQQVKVYEALDSYSELSPSGNGLHIICKASIPSGRKRSSIEVYSSHRYITFTGNIWGPETRGIASRQEIFSVLWAELSPGGKRDFVAIDEPETYPDHELCMRASNVAQNGQLFCELWAGNWQQHYPSQSEADFALIDLISFWSNNKAQIKRLFLQSGLGQRAKAKREDYIETMINRSFDNKLPPVDIEGLAEAVRAVFYANAAPVTGLPASGAASLYPHHHHGAEEDDTGAYNGPSVNLPPGVVGMAAQYFYTAAHRPIAEAAVVAALGMMAGICGRAYNTPTGAGLNLYLILLAKTAVGKELMSSGISKLFTKLKKDIPAVDVFIGPSEIRSDAALLRVVEKQPSCVSFITEFGIMLAAMCAPNASSHLTGLRKVLLDLYGKSGEGNVLRPMAYSDTHKNTAAINCPAFSIIGDATPETFYPNLDELLIAQGLLPRFCVVEYRGNRPSANENAAFIEPSQELIQSLSAIITQSLDLAHKGQIVRIGFSEEARKLNHHFDKFCDDQINTANKDIYRSLWSRAHLKTMKIASILAIGVHPYNPIITDEMWLWAQEIVERDVTNVMKRFDEGTLIGGAMSPAAQEADVLRIIKDYYRKHFTEIRAYMSNLYNVAEQVHRDGIIPYGYIQRRTSNLSSFRLDRQGATAAVQRTLKNLCDAGTLTEIDRRQIVQKYSVGFRGFILNM